MIVPFPQAFAGACGFDKEASEPRASVSAPRDLTDIFFDSIKATVEAFDR